MRVAASGNISNQAAASSAPTRTGPPAFLRTLARLAWLFLRHPGRAIDELRAEPRALFLGLAFLVAGLAVYAVVAARIYSVGYRPRAVPLTLFPAETWYLLQAFITIPVGVVAAFAFSGITYAICRAWGGEGTFDATFGVSAFSLHLPMLIFMWLPEIFVAPALYGRAGHGLPWPMWVELLRIFLVPLPWAGFVAALGLSRVHGLSLARSGLAVLVAALPTSLMTAAFLR